VAEPSKRPASVLPALEPGSVFAGYRVESVLDRGGMGVVYKAIDPDLDRPVALKIIAPEYTQNTTAVARFKAECRLAASLEHPNIVPIHRGGDFEGVLYLAMRFVPGTNLRHVIDRGPMDLRAVARIVAQVGSALDAAHDRGLVHRDVKPANILVTAPGAHEQVYLTDFGLTKRLGSVGALTRTGGWVGTPDYVAPEQIQGHNVDRRADVYSLGCVLFEMLTGRVAYVKDSDMAKLWAHVTDPPPLPRTERPELVEAFDDIVSRATAKDPEDRYPTAGALSAAVGRAVDEQEAARERAVAEPIGPPDLGLSATRDEPFNGAPPAGVAGEPPAPHPVAARPGPPPPPSPPPPRGAAAAAPVPGSGDPPARKPPGRRGASSGGGWIRGHALLLAIAALIVGAGIAALALGGSGSSSSPTPTPVAGQRVSSKLGPVPTNRVNGSGNAVMRLNGRTLTISINSKGLLNGASHALHIHAGRKGVCPPASAAGPHNGHISIATHAGVPYYGPAVEALTTRGDTTIKSLVAFDRYPTTANVRYRRTIHVTPIVASYIRKNNAVLVAHGIDYNHNGVYDGVLERSDLNRSLTGESTAPALCGPLVAEKKAGGKGTKKTAQSRAGQSGTSVYTVALAAQPTAPPDPVALLCPMLAAKETRFPRA
jgi:serine/threonine protein kinase/Cu/Zn superoxide dismutase